MSVKISPFKDEITIPRKISAVVACQGGLLWGYIVNVYYYSVVSEISI